MKILPKVLVHMMESRILVARRVARVLEYMLVRVPSTDIYMGIKHSINPP
jgi:hypothetical protein